MLASAIPSVSRLDRRSKDKSEGAEGGRMKEEVRRKMADITQILRSRRTVGAVRGE